MFDYIGEDEYRNNRYDILKLVKDFFNMIDISNFRIYLNKIEIIDKDIKPYRVYLEEYLRERYRKDIKVDYITKTNLLEIKVPKETFNGEVR